MANKENKVNANATATAFSLEELRAMLATAEAEQNRKDLAGMVENYKALQTLPGAKQAGLRDSLVIAYIQAKGHTFTSAERAEIGKDRIRAFISACGLEDTDKNGGGYVQGLLQFLNACGHYGITATVTLSPAEQAEQAK